MENPILLALPQRHLDKTAQADADRPESDEPALDTLQAIETGSSPWIEQQLLRELLQRSPGLVENLTDPTEVHNYASAPASLSDYKHRLQAIRCEYIQARIRTEDLQVQLKQSHYEIGRLQKHIEYLDGIIAHMRASRGWQLVERCSRLRQSISRFLRRFRTSAQDG